MKDKVTSIGCEIIAIVFIILSVYSYADAHGNYKGFDRKRYQIPLSKKPKKNNSKN